MRMKGIFAAGTSFNLPLAHANRGWRDPKVYPTKLLFRRIFLGVARRRHVSRPSMLLFSTRFRTETAMRKLSLVALAGLAIVAGAQANAADLPPKPVYKAAPPPAQAPYYSWTGFYIGAHFGYGWAKPEVTNPFTGAPVGSTTPRPKGILGGVQIGYNYQIANLVVGLEGDFTWSDVKDTENCFDCAPGGLVVFGHPDWFGSLAARVGYAFDRLLLYAKTGPYRVHEQFRQTAISGPHCAITCSGSDQDWGWLIAGGIEYAVLGNWSVKIEYDFMDFEKKVLTISSNSVGDQNIFDVRRTIQVVKFGVNYKFDFGKAPIITARY